MLLIDPLFFLFLCEGAIVVFGLAVFFFVRSRKYRRLFEESERSRSALPPLPQEQPQLPVAEKSPAPEPPAAVPEVQAIEEPVVAEQEQEAVPQNIRKLLEIIEHQKQKIVELLCLRDMLDDAYRQLDMLRQKNEELETRIVSLVESSADSQAFGEVAAAVQSSNADLGKYLTILQGSSVSLGAKMSEWEEQLKVLWQQAREIANELPQAHDIASGTVSSGEAADLMEKLRVSEESLKKSQDDFTDLSKQYEDLEKEFMVLYRQQQQGAAAG
ncbi:MAG TPA: hypothetical protein VK445_00950 [Dissulfurispiraceae bacterium]|nr:hypothetical protein [Dissulfurispiraceae bacterium]